MTRTKQNGHKLRQWKKEQSVHDKAGFRNIIDYSTDVPGVNNIAQVTRLLANVFDHHNYSLIET